MNMNQAIQELSALWKQQGGQVHEFIANQKLWHSGVIDFNNLINRQAVIWFTPDSDQQDYYNQRAREDAARGHGVAYKNELSNLDSFKLAVFGPVHFHEITANFLNTDHANLNQALFQFAVKNKLHGIIRGKTNNEIALTVDALQFLELIHKTSL